MAAVVDLGPTVISSSPRESWRRAARRSGMSPRFYTAPPDYLWLNRLHCLGIGQAFLERSEVAYDVYAVR